MRLTAPFLLATLTAGAAPAQRPISPATAHPAFLSASQIVQRMEASSVNYKIVTASTAQVDARLFPSLDWPQEREEVSRPVVTRGSDGQETVVAYRLRPGLEPLMAAAESLYESGRFQEAAYAFEAVTQADPSCYPAHLYLGDCDYAAGDSQGALREYQTAVRLNPNDYQTSYFLGDALFRLHRYPEAIEAYTDALVARPGYRPMIEALLQKAHVLGVTVHDDRFRPLAIARRDGKDVEVIVADDFDDDPPWVAYALCKAWWMGDAAHRQQMGVDGGARWSSIEESECLSDLDTAYLAGRRTLRIHRDGALDRLAEAGRAGLLDAFATYEIGGRMDPHVTLTLNDAERARVREYVRRFILVPWAELRAAPAPSGSPR